MVFIFIYLILYFCIPLCFGLDLGCRDLKGKPVDWFVAYKLPDLPTTKKGSQFLYMDPKTPTWRQSDLPITDPKSAIGKTFAQLWEAKKNSEVLYAVYNDDDPGTNRTDSYRAHMKGAMAFDDFTGFWVIHSVPRFIDLSKRLYSYPDSGLKYGQIFFCATYSVTALLEIGKHLEFSQPSTTQFRIPPSFSKLFPALSRALERKRLSSKAGDYTISQNIETLAGVKLKIFAKNRKFEKDLYSNFVASELNTPFLVESWLNGAASDLPSNCNGIGKVYNLRSVALDNGKYAFSSSKDHSKWAVSAPNEGGAKIVCIGDTNRQKSQNARGGGTLCITDSNLHKLFRSSVDTIECCGKPMKASKSCD